MAFDLLGEITMNLITWFILAFMNIYGFILMGFDKRKAKKGQFRISERALWITAICGGAIGTTIGMNVFRHKTKHTSFRIGMPLLVVVELVLIFIYINY